MVISHAIFDSSLLHLVPPTNTDMKPSTAAFLVFLLHTLPLLTNAITTGVLRTHPIPKLSRVECDVAHPVPAWLDSFEDYSPIWLETETTIHMLHREYAEVIKELTSARHVQNAAKLKFHIRHLQRKNADLLRLIQSLAPIPGQLQFTKRQQFEWYQHKILRRKSEPLKKIESISDPYSTGQNPDRIDV